MAWKFCRACSTVDLPWFVTVCCRRKKRKKNCGPAKAIRNQSLAALRCESYQLLKKIILTKIQADFFTKSTEKLRALGFSRMIYINVDSPCPCFPYFNFLGGASKKSSCNSLRSVTLCKTLQERRRAMDWFEVELKQLSSISLSQSPKLRDSTAAYREFKS